MLGISGRGGAGGEAPEGNALLGGRGPPSDRCFGLVGPAPAVEISDEMAADIADALAAADAGESIGDWRRIGSCSVRTFTSSNRDPECDRNNAIFVPECCGGEIDCDPQSGHPIA
jgi:hypothetical protein